MPVLTWVPDQGGSPARLFSSLGEAGIPTRVAKGSSTSRSCVCLSLLIFVFQTSRAGDEGLIVAIEEINIVMNANSTKSVSAYGIFQLIFPHQSQMSFNTTRITVAAKDTMV